MKKTISVLLTFIIVILNFIPVHASDSFEKSIKEYEYRCYLSSPIPYTSKKFDDLLISDNITQFVFFFKGYEEYTIGVCSSNKFTRDYLIQQLNLNIAQVNDEIANQSENKTNSCNNNLKKLEINDLELIYFEFVEEHDLNETYENKEFKENIDGEIYCLNAFAEENISERYSKSKYEESISKANNELLKLPINYCYHKTVSGREMYHDGFSNTDSYCSTNLSSPHKGDGNRRYSSGHNWLPTRIHVGFESNVSPGYNKTKLYFMYNSENYRNLNSDSNEALELEVVFFNYYNNPVSRRGRAYQYAINCSWNSNMGSSAYLDTNFGDIEYEVHMCVGCSDTSTLSQNSLHYWTINSVADAHTDSYPNDGKFHIVCQRSYRYLGSGAWHVYGEEHEQLWYPLLTETLDWYENSAYYYADTGTSIYYYNGEDPVW
ncbi:MAG: hypothetical protein Q4C64_03500 [Erysipelotrichia bacterium]|nr:hypothetical protein [Erysipelotrichia bacterium]